MLQDIVNIIKNVSLRHKAVHTFKYQDAILINAQGHNKKFEVVVDTASMHQLLISNSPVIFTSTFDLYILGFVSTDTDILTVQSQAYDIALQIVNKIMDLDEYKGLIDVYDYSILTLHHYSDDNDAGVKLNIELRVPFAICDLDEYFDDEPKEQEEIIIENEDKEINLKPIKLPTNPIKTCGC